MILLASFESLEWGFKRKCVITEAKKAKAVLVRQTLGFVTLPIRMF